MWNFSEETVSNTQDNKSKRHTLVESNDNLNNKVASDSKAKDDSLKNLLDKNSVPTRIFASHM